jgi:hypothetical protein
MKWLVRQSYWAVLQLRLERAYGAFSSLQKNDSKESFQF